MNNKDVKTVNSVMDVFPISEFDKEGIREFQKSHDSESHPQFRNFYTYSFTPMPLGFFGVCKCEYCGEEYHFMSLFS